jgi:glucokinase
MGMATSGLFLGGGIPPKILPILKEPHFMNAFLDKGRFKPLLAKVPVRVITHSRIGLLGAAIHGVRTGILS